MMGLLEYYFPMIVLGVACSYWAIGLFLVFLRVPSSDTYMPYRRAQKFLATTYFIIGGNLFAWLKLFRDDWQTFNPAVLSIDVVLFFLAAIFFSYCFYDLLDKNFLTKKRVMFDFSVWGLTVLLMSLALIDSLHPYIHWSLGMSLTLYFSMLCVFLYSFHTLYKRKKKQLDEYFSEDMQKFLFWTKKSLLLLMLAALLAVVSASLGIYFNFAYQFYVVTVNFYIAISFLNYSWQYSNMDRATVVPQEEEQVVEVYRQPGASHSFEQQFGAALVCWIDDKKYLTSQITIDDLASDIGTNKLYMSRYINTRYGVNFSQWITDLRLEEAKDFMRVNPSAKLEEVAFHSGFSSSSYFSKVFSRVEGISPAIWRREILGGRRLDHEDA